MKPGALVITVVDHEQHRSVVHEFTRGPVRIGRDPENELPLAYRFVSSWHAVVRFDGLSARVEDLGTVNGLSVDGTRVKPGGSVAVRGRLVVAVGPLELIVEHTSAEPRRPPAASMQPTPEDELHARDSLAVYGAINTDEPPVLGSGQTMAMNLSRVHGATLRLRPLHDALTAAHAAWTAEYAEATRELQASRDDMGLALLGREFPPIGSGATGPVIVDGADAELYRQAELGAVAQTAEELVHGLRGPADLDETRRFLSRVTDVLKTFAVATVEQLAAMERLDSELGLQIDRDRNPVLAAITSEELLRMLLDWRDGRAERTAPLVEALASVVARPAAMLRGALKAGRRVSEQLAPREIDRSVSSSWPTRSRALWRRFEERYEALFGDNEDGWSRTLREQVARDVHAALTRAGVPVAPMETEEAEEYP